MSEEADVEIVGWKGDNPLADYPHARFHCAKVPFSGAAESACPMCYCWVCDVPAASCGQWISGAHYTATPASERWKEARRVALISRRRSDHGKKRAVSAPAAAPAFCWSTVLNDAGRLVRPFVDPLALPINLTRHEPVRVVSTRAPSTRTRKQRGTFCSCYTIQNAYGSQTTTASSCSAAKGQGLDSIVCAVSHFKAVAEQTHFLPQLKVQLLRGDQAFE